MFLNSLLILIGFLFRILKRFQFFPLSGVVFSLSFQKCCNHLLCIQCLYSPINTILNVKIEAERTVCRRGLWFYTANSDKTCRAGWSGNYYQYCTDHRGVKTVVWISGGSHCFFTWGCDFIRSLAIKRAEQGGQRLIVCSGVTVRSNTYILFFGYCVRKKVQYNYNTFTIFLFNDFLFPLSFQKHCHNLFCSLILYPQRTTKLNVEIAKSNPTEITVASIPGGAHGLSPRVVILFGC